MARLTRTNTWSGKCAFTTGRGTRKNKSRKLHARTFGRTAVEAIGISRFSREEVHRRTVSIGFAEYSSLVQSASVLCSLFAHVETRHRQLSSSLLFLISNAKIFSTFTFFNPRHHVNFYRPHRSCRRGHRRNWASRRFPTSSGEPQRQNGCPFEGAPSILPR